MHADHVGQEEVDRLAEHRRLGLDAADAPADDAEPVDHRRVRVGADQRVGIQHAVLLEDAARQELEVHLVADAEARRDDPQAVERLRSPLEEPIALAVAAELHLHVEAERIVPAEVVDLHGVIDHQIDGNRAAAPARRHGRGAPPPSASRRDRRAAARR